MPLFKGSDYYEVTAEVTLKLKATCEFKKVSGGLSDDTDQLDAFTVLSIEGIVHEDEYGGLDDSLIVSPELTQVIKDQIIDTASELIVDLEPGETRELTDEANLMGQPKAVGKRGRARPRPMR